MARILTIVTYLSLFLSQSCRDVGDQLTIVKGVITNKITDERLQGVPLEIWECANGLNLQGPMCDSLKATFTKGDGSYEMNFLTKEGFHYKFGVPHGNMFEGIAIPWDGTILIEGNTNLINQSTIPYKVLQLEISIGKQNKNFLYVDLRTTDSEGGFLHRIILVDTTRSKQLIDTTIYSRVLPLRNYGIETILCNKNLYLEKTDCEFERKSSFFVPYEDTTTMTIK